MNVNACVPLNVPRNRPATPETNDASRPLVKDDASHQDRTSSQREDKASDAAR